MSNTARWAVLGAGEISGDFLRALPHARLGALHAVGARDAARATAPLRPAEDAVLLDTTAMRIEHAAAAAIALVQARLAP
mgnify:CR=1 FL=1